jgi:uncharacterized membrane protein
MEAICSSEKSIDFQRTTRRYIPEDRTLHNHRCENLKSYVLLTLYIVYFALMMVIKYSEGDMTFSSIAFIPAFIREYTTNRTVCTSISSELPNVACVLQDHLPLRNPRVRRRVDNSLSLCQFHSMPYFC